MCPASVSALLEDRVTIARPSTAFVGLGQPPLKSQRLRWASESCERRHGVGVRDKIRFHPPLLEDPDPVLQADACAPDEFGGLSSLGFLNFAEAAAPAQKDVEGSSAQSMPGATNFIRKLREELLVRVLKSLSPKSVSGLSSPIEAEHENPKTSTQGLRRHQPHTGGTPRRARDAETHQTAHRPRFDAQQQVQEALDSEGG